MSVSRVLLAAAVCVSALSPTLALGTDRPRTARPVPTPALSPRATVADVQGAYDATEKAIEAEYANLVREARSEISALEDKIKDLEKQIAALEGKAKRVSSDAAKLDEIDKAIASLKNRIKSLRGQIALIDQEIARLEKAKAAEIAALRKQKAKALENVRRSPSTATPTAGGH